MNLFVLVISLWGFTGTEWQYVGNQIVYQEPMSKEQCEEMTKHFAKYEYNEFYRMSLQCVSADDDKKSRSL
tara:strand:- start:3593 stop:3805 length:213 start_codon:yes stop_codon:yes gene_type:complete